MVDVSRILAESGPEPTKVGQEITNARNLSKDAQAILADNKTSCSHNENPNYGVHGRLIRSKDRILNDANQERHLSCRFEKHKV
jgi:hypothetical protein